MIYFVNMEKEHRITHRSLSNVVRRVVSVLSTVHTVGFPSRVWPQEQPVLGKEAKGQEKPK